MLLGVICTDGSLSVRRLRAGLAGAFDRGCSGGLAAVDDHGVSDGERRFL
jgi:hypothetical protein